MKKVWGASLLSRVILIATIKRISSRIFLSMYRVSQKNVTLLLRSILNIIYSNTFIFSGVIIKDKKFV